MCQCANWLLLAPRFARICDIRCSFSVGGFCFIDFPRQGEDWFFYRNPPLRSELLLFSFYFFLDEEKALLSKTKR